MSKLGFPWTASRWPKGVNRKPPTRKTGMNYDTEWSRKYPARLARAILLDNLIVPTSFALLKPSVIGEENLDALEPPVIFAPNHSSHLDTPLLLSLLPPKFRHHTVVAAGADYFFDRTWKAVLSSLLFASIPIDRTKVSRQSAYQALKLLEKGWNLVIYPEGGRSPDGWFQEFKPGAAYLAVRSGRPVVPVYIHGTRSILPKGSNKVHPRGARVSVIYGHLIQPYPQEDIRELSSRIEQAVAALADEYSNSWWTSRLNAARGTTPSKRGPSSSSWRRSWELELPSNERSGGEGQDKRWPL